MRPLLTVLSVSALAALGFFFFTKKNPDPTPVATPVVVAPEAPAKLEEPMPTPAPMAEAPAEVVEAPVAPVVKAKPTKAPKVPPVAPAAREALAFVGVNDEAEKVWADAIYNTALPAKERRELVEDLDRDGFKDRKNLTSDDLNLIQSRLLLIEKHAANTNDTLVLTALMEAQKDLIRMQAKALLAP